jgi:hypothetical protein
MSGLMGILKHHPLLVIEPLCLPSGRSNRRILGVGWRVGLSGELYEFEGFR